MQLIEGINCLSDVDEKVTALVLAAERIDAVVVGQGITIQDRRRFLKELARKVKKGSIQNALADIQDHQDALKEIPQKNNTLRVEAQNILTDFPHTMRGNFSHYAKDQLTPDETVAWFKRDDVDHIWEKGNRFRSKHAELAKL